jgi:hypothetical protein
LALDSVLTRSVLRHVVSDSAAPACAQPNERCSRRTI